MFKLNKKLIYVVTIILIFSLVLCNFSVHASEFKTSTSENVSSVEVESKDILQLPMVNAQVNTEEFPAEYWSAAAEDEPAIVDGCYEIRTPENLTWLALNKTTVKEEIKLMNDIDLGGKLWKPILELTGQFYGQNHTIKNLTIKSTESYQGLFKSFRPSNDFGYIRDLYLEDVNINTTGDYVGAIVSINEGWLNNCHVTGVIKGNHIVGGLVGWNYHKSDTYTHRAKASISFSSTNAKIMGNDTVGGLVGDNMANVEACFTEGEVYGNGGVGGLVGNNTDVVGNCYSHSNIVNTKEIASDLEYMDLFVQQDVVRNATGGLVGTNGSIDVYNSYSTGTVTSVAGVKNMLGYIYKSTNCYYDYESSNLGKPSETNNYYGTAKTTAEMKSPMMATLLNNDGGNIWTYKANLNEGYPILKWQLGNDAERVTLNSNLYTDLTTDDMWDKMQIQAFINKGDHTVIIKDGNKYYKSSGTRGLADNCILGVYDINDDGEYELLFIDNAGSGISYEMLWCYSKSKTVHCGFGFNATHATSPTAIIENEDGTFNINVRGNTDGKITVEEINGEQWLTVTYPDDTVFEQENMISVEQSIANMMKSRKNTIGTVLVVAENFFAGDNYISFRQSPATSELVAVATLPIKATELAVICLYKDGIMIECLLGNGEGDTEVALKSQRMSEADAWKIMLWDGSKNMIPVCTPYYIEKP